MRTQRRRVDLPLAVVTVLIFLGSLAAFGWPAPVLLVLVGAWQWRETVDPTPCLTDRLRDGVGAVRKLVD